VANTRLKGWFKLPGKDGDRTLAEQMIGLAPALAEARGKSVLDLGCAEGLIGREFAQAGATVLGIECNPETVTAARKTCGELVRIEQADLNTTSFPAGRWDIVLALAILHKLRYPARAVSDIAGTGAGLVVVRLPSGSTGQFTTKNHGAWVDVNLEFKARGFALESVTTGPRREIVQYWRRS